MKRQIKNAIYAQLARSTKALCHPKRIEILDLLSQGEKTVEVIAKQTDLGLKNTSAQLKELKSALLIESRKDGKYVYYQLANRETNEFLFYLRKFSERQFSELQKIASKSFSSSEDVEALDQKQLFSKVKRGEVVLLDVRPTDEFQYAHLPFACSIPLNELSQQLKTLPKKKKIIVYCRGPYCFYAKDAVELLKKNGFIATHLRDGINDWESEGLPVIRTKVL
jgi:rhodanese-related sulfurtransferase